MRRHACERNLPFRESSNGAGAGMSERIQRGFHRLGIGFAVPFVIGAALCLALALWLLTSPMPQDPGEMPAHLGALLLFFWLAITAATVYVALRVIGWIVAWFMEK
jgi:hypothetical protein